MSILKKILQTKTEEISARKKLRSEKELANTPLFERETLPLTDALMAPGASGVIAEIKRRSPSKGVINEAIDVTALAKGYAKAGASALSILTDETYFGGSSSDISAVREQVPCPILRKDFIIDRYQILEARAIGADVILLIAKALEQSQCKELAHYAREMGLQVLLEVHEESELESHLNDFVDVVGVNNRSLATFQVDTRISFIMASIIPPEYVRITESGLHDVATITALKQHGFNGFLIGEIFMKERRPEDACAKLISDLRNS